MYLANEPNYILVASSLSFALPCITAYLHENYLTAQISSLLMLTSIQFHGNPSLLSFLLDQSMIYLFVLQSGYTAYLVGFYGIMCSLLLNIYGVFIYYGPCRNRFIHHPNHYIASMWHGSLHVFPAIALSVVQPFTHKMNDTS
jgi:hypothetical protein